MKSRSRSDRMEFFANNAGFSAPQVTTIATADRWVPAAYLLPSEGVPVLVKRADTGGVMLARLDVEAGAWWQVGVTNGRFMVDRRDEWTCIPFHQTLTRDEARALRDRYAERTAA